MLETSFGGSQTSPRFVGSNCVSRAILLVAWLQWGGWPCLWHHILGFYTHALAGEKVAYADLGDFHRNAPTNGVAVLRNFWQMVLQTRPRAYWPKISGSLLCVCKGARHHHFNENGLTNTISDCMHSKSPKFIHYYRNMRMSYRQLTYSILSH